MAEHLKYTYYQSRSQNGRLWTESKSQNQAVKAVLDARKKIPRNY